MHLFYCDETNLEERSGDFLIYGGIVVEAEAALKLSKAVDDLRTRHKVPEDYRFKFNPGPKGFSHEQFISLKQELIEITAAHGAKLVVYLILHDIASSPDVARRNGINTVCYHFQCILERTGGPGLVLLDRFNDEGNAIEAHLRDKFSTGITGLPYTPKLRLESILGFHYSAIGQSHFPTIVDVVLGSLRFALNVKTRGQAELEGSALTLLGLISPLLWRSEEGKPVPELGLQFSPKTVKAPVYRAKYVALKNFLETGGISTYQKITGDPTF